MPSLVVSGIVARIFFGNDDLLTGHWFDVLSLVLTMAAVLAFVTGIIFGLFHEFIRLGIGYELAPALAEATTATRTALEVMADTLRRTSWLAAGVGYVLIYGIGVLLFSFAILQTSVVPKWIGWLGLIVVAVHVALLTLLSGVFYSIRPPWLWPVAAGTSLVWVLAMGVVLLRLKEPVAPDSVA